MPCIDTVQGFYFCPAVYQLLTIVYGCLSAVNAIIPPQRQNRLQGFTGAFPLICHIPARTIQQAHKPPIHHLRHAGGHTVKRCTSTDTRHHRHAGRCTAQHSRPIIIMYIRVAVHPVIDQCPAVHHIADHTSSGGGSVHPACIRCRGQTGGLSALPALSGLRSGTGQQSGRTLHPAGQSSSERAEPLAATAASLFGLSPDSQ